MARLTPERIAVMRTRYDHSFDELREISGMRLMDEDLPDLLALAERASDLGWMASRICEKHASETQRVSNDNIWLEIARALSAWLLGGE